MVGLSSLDEVHAILGEKLFKQIAEKLRESPHREIAFYLQNQALYAKIGPELWKVELNPSKLTPSLTTV